MPGMKEAVVANKRVTRTNKTVIEKMRRDRINTCLNQLQAIILQAKQNEFVISPHKLEKADILELTVKYMRDLANGHNEDKNKADLDSFYVLGFRSCVQEAMNRIDTEPELSDPQKWQLTNSLRQLKHVNISVDRETSVGSERNDIKGIRKEHERCSHQLKAFEPCMSLPYVTALEKHSVQNVHETFLHLRDNSVSYDSVSSDSVSSDGVSSNSVSSDCISSDGVSSDGVPSDCVLSDGVSSVSVSSYKVLSDRLAPDWVNFNSITPVTDTILVSNAKVTTLNTSFANGTDKKISYNKMSNCCPIKNENKTMSDITQASNKTHNLYQHEMNENQISKTRQNRQRLHRKKEWIHNYTKVKDAEIKMPLKNKSAVIRKQPLSIHADSSVWRPW